MFTKKDGGGGKKKKKATEPVALSALKAEVRVTADTVSNKDISCIIMIIL
jgi:hypothetical protein